MTRSIQTMGMIRSNILGRYTGARDRYRVRFQAGQRSADTLIDEPETELKPVPVQMHQLDSVAI